MTENVAEDVKASEELLIFTDDAASKVKGLIEEEGNPNLMLRVFVTGGGCSGFQYGFTFDERTEDGDSSIENHGVTLVVDPMSVQYLMGAEIDYKDPERIIVAVLISRIRTVGRHSGQNSGRADNRTGMTAIALASAAIMPCFNS